MKRRLIMLLAIMLTGGMLVACGPGGEEATDDTVGGGGGVVDEPLGGDAGAELGGEVDGGAGLETDLGAETTEEPMAEEPMAEEPMAEEPTTEEPLTQEPAVEEPTMEEPAAAGEGAEGDVAGGGAAAPATGEPIVVTISQATDGLAVQNIEGAQDAEAIASTEETNPALNLTTGQRYEFVYEGEGDLVFYNAEDEPVLSTAGLDSAFAQDPEVNAEAQDGRLSFTLTESLADELSRYAGGPDEQGGSINVN